MLILDDDAAVGQTIQWIAESLGFEAEFVTRPEEFFQRVEAGARAIKPPSILMIDLAMPEVDGVEVMRQLAARKCEARIIISSGMGSRVLDAARRSASEHGLSIAGVIPKPLTKEALRAIAGAGDDSDAPSAPEDPSRPRSSAGVTEADLRQAIEQGEIGMVYQPKIECRSGAPAGIEALVRWNSPSRGTIAPDEFIPLAEQSGLIDVLTDDIFRKSLEWFARSFAHSPLKMSLNISAKSLVDIRLADSLLSLCRSYGVAPEGIVLELTETSAMVDPTLSLDLMTRFRVKGFHLSIDDFGTGYSSMVQLARLPFSELKVDKSFVMEQRQTRESRTIIKSVIDLGHSLGLMVSAEGVENRETLEYLDDLGCDLAQGYYIARPMPGDAVKLWLEQRWRSFRP
jgi:EAL domain-containing protein (putative c-di-GMP-specific phosphodiesterase class I)